MRPFSGPTWTHARTTLTVFVFTLLVYRHTQRHTLVPFFLFLVLNFIFGCLVALYFCLVVVLVLPVFFFLWWGLRRGPHRHFTELVLLALVQAHQYSSTTLVCRHRARIVAFSERGFVRAYQRTVRVAPKSNTQGDAPGPRRRDAGDTHCPAVW